MSDKPDIEIVPNMPASEEAPTQRPGKRRWLIFLGVFVLILALLVCFLLANGTSLDSAKRFFRYLGKEGTSYGDIRFETYGTCSYDLFQNALAVGTQSGTTLFAEDGDTVARVQGSFSQPALLSAGSYLLNYDIGGTRLALISAKGDTLFDLTCNGAIYDADLSPNGYVCVLYEGTDCRATLEVYEKSGALLYRYNAKSHYLNACAISNNGALAVASVLGQKDVTFTGSVLFLKTSSEDTPAELSLGNQLLYDLRFLTADTFCAVGENSLCFVGTDGEQKGEFTANNGKLEGYSFGGDGFVAILTDSYESGSTCRLTALNYQGDELATIGLGQSPVHLSANGSYLSLLTEQELMIFGSGLNLQSRTDSEGYLAAFVRPDGTAICVSSGAAKLYIP